MRIARFGNEVIIKADSFEALQIGEVEGGYMLYLFLENGNTIKLWEDIYKTKEEAILKLKEIEKHLMEDA